MSGIEHALIGGATFVIVALIIFWVKNDPVRYRRLIGLATIFTFVLIVLGAYVRLSDAGLGCPDWPGCYGNLTPYHSSAEIKSAEANQPGGPVSMAKAWKEMGHRYLAMFVGACIAAILLIAWRNRRTFSQSPVLATCIAGVVIVQATLGAWTVTMLLKPAIVTSHLIGGMLLLVLLGWLALRQYKEHFTNWNEGCPVTVTPALKIIAAMALAIVAAQIILGGWVSTNYAALACSDFPQCNGQWIPSEMKFSDAFHIIRPLGVGPDGELLTIESLRAIHWVHRAGALVVVIFLLFAMILFWRFAGLRREMFVLGLLLTLQVLLGVANIIGSLPLPVAVAHNGCAALLLLCLIWINFKLHQTRM